MLSILYRYKEEEFYQLITEVLGILGFEPKYMDVNVFKKPLEDVGYSEKKFFNFLKKKPNTITLKNQLYDEEMRESNYWLRIKLSIDSPFKLDTYSLELKNKDLISLLQSSEFDSLINRRSLIYAYCYNQFDSLEQSDDRIFSFERTYPDKEYKIVKGKLNDNVVDISNNWGRSITTRGFTFMAAPLMWFGDEFFKIVPQNLLLGLDRSKLVHHNNYSLVKVKLFEPDDDPRKDINRQQQKKFWTNLELVKRIEDFERERPLDVIAWYKERALMNKRKSK